MYITKQWPDKDLLPIPEGLYALLLEQLIEGFDTVDKARHFWAVIPSTLIVIQQSDDHRSLSDESQEVQRLIAHALDFPEYVIPLGGDYRLAVAIYTDEGAGIYLLVHHHSPIARDLIYG